MTHQEAQELLALSAAGLLDGEGERGLREHARACEACRSQMEALSVLSGALSSRPAPAMPENLMLRTQARLAAELALRVERRRSVWIAAGAALLAWVLNLATWLLIRWWRPELPGVWTWLGLSTATAIVAAPAAAFIARQGTERRI
ncbi:MAG TPA: hypothetical protein VG456_13845 [Candidatus Sulfopaludibacter sp.]|jgi:hypothetical protein|nr:hypothetical protein [Candidatus Sulfopaludibacter sp.]